MGEKFMQFNLLYFPYCIPTAKCTDLGIYAEAYSILSAAVISAAALQGFRGLALETYII